MDNKISEKIRPIEYLTFNGSTLVKENIQIDLELSQEIKKRDKRKLHKCFYNASLTVDHEFDYVLGFIVDGGSIVFEHGWNRKNNSNLIIDVTLDKKTLKLITSEDKLPHDGIYVEVIRFPREEMVKLIAKTNGDAEFYLHFDEYKKMFREARVAILDLYKPLHVKWLY